MDQQTKAILFRRLHHNGEMLVLPNIWDPLGAMLLQDIGYTAVATASAAVAYANGFPDGEQIPFDDVLKRLSRIAGSVNIPVTADIESGYSKTVTGLGENIKKLIDTGIVGINIEDSDKQNDTLMPVEVQCDRISVAKKAAAETGIPLFINVRIDVYIRGTDLDNDEKLAETINRGKAYVEAGADCLFPIAANQTDHIKEIISSIDVPVNIIAMPGVPGLKTLAALGVSRVSVGSGFLKLAIKAMKATAARLRNFEGMDEITSNEITSDYLKKLIGK